VQKEMKEEKKEMLSMSQVHSIRDLNQLGYRISEIAKETGTDVKTVRKYIQQEDFSPESPAVATRPSILDPYKEIIYGWLEEDKKHWRKQRHTAERVLERLRKEHGYTGSYSPVQRYLKKCRERAITKGSMELVWEPGPAQVDFGEADVYEDGQLIRKKFLTVSFPYSNDGYSQLFGGETAECVCQGLQDTFEYIGGVPPLLILDNATGVGRRVGDAIHETELFGRFRNHYRFQARFCNPYAGYEKGHVERKVGYNRSNLFVPIPRYQRIEEYNRTLLDRHREKAEEGHYKKGVPIKELFEEDRKALLHLPAKLFNVCRYEWLQADGYGKVCLDGKHYYSTRPEYAKSKVMVGIRAHWVEVLTKAGQVLVNHPRQYGDVRTDVSDYSTSLAMLMKNIGAWHNSGIRQQTSETLREYMDNQEKGKRRDCIRIMDELTRQYGFPAAVMAMERAASRGEINLCDAAVLAARMTGYGIDTPPDPGPPLAVYDQVFLGKGGGL
jgi:transposase